MLWWQGRCEPSATWGCDGHAVNDTILAYGQLLVDDPEIGPIQATGKDQTLFNREAVPHPAVDDHIDSPEIRRTVKPAGIRGPSHRPTLRRRSSQLHSENRGSAIRWPPTGHVDLDPYCHQRRLSSFMSEYPPATPVQRRSAVHVVVIGQLWARLDVDAQVLPRRPHPGRDVVPHAALAEAFDEAGPVENLSGHVEHAHEIQLHPLVARRSRIRSSASTLVVSSWDVASRSSKTAWTSSCCSTSASTPSAIWVALAQNRESSR